MSKYTTEVRYICEVASGKTESAGYSSIDEILTKAAPLVFNFSFPIYDEEYRLVLEKKILKHFYTREISEETVGLWKLRLDAKLNEIMPYYNKLYSSALLEFNPLYTVNLTTNKTSNGSENKTGSNNVIDTRTSNKTTSSTGSVTTNNTDSSSGTSSSSNSGTSENLYSDTPQGDITGISDKTYLTNATKNTDSATGSSNTSATDNFEGTVNSTDSGTDNSTDNYSSSRQSTDAVTSTDTYLETVAGYSGSNASDLLLKYRETFLNIDVMIINELEPLFFQLW